MKNDLREIAVAADRIDGFCAAHGLPQAVAYAVNLSVDELLTNTFSYGYEEGTVHRIDIAVRMDDGVIVVEITDDAAPFDPFEIERPDTGAALQDRPVGGLGIHLVREMMDGYRYCRRDGRNIVTLTRDTRNAGGPP